MAEQGANGISWTDETWNPIRGCSKVSEGCRNCYAMHVAARFSKPGLAYHGLALDKPARWTGQVAVVPEHMLDPYGWQRPRRIFVNSMSDLFHDNVPDDVIDQVVAVMAMAPQHQFQVLTKRPARMASYLAQLGGSLDKNNVHRHLRTWGIDAGFKVSRRDSSKASTALADPGGWPLPNVCWGTSAEDQPTLDDRAKHLLACRPHAAVLWLSLEPLLGGLTLRGLQPFTAAIGAAAVECPHGFDYCPACDGGKGIDWVVVGGESGAKARPMNPAWVRQIRDECSEARVLFHFKQWGAWAPSGRQTEPEVTEPTFTWPNQSKRLVGHALFPGGQSMRMVGKKAAGRLLDGQVWDGMPAMPAGR